MLKKSEVGMSNEERLAVLETTNTHIIESLFRIENRIINLDTKVDSRFDKLNDRMWTLFFWMIGGFASILGILAHADHWV